MKIKKMISGFFLTMCFSLLTDCAQPNSVTGDTPANDSKPTYTVTYKGNGATGGSVPVDPRGYKNGETVKVSSAGSLIKTGVNFVSWNTEMDGTGTQYMIGESFVMGSSNIVLYAQWSSNPVYTVTYVGNGNTGGTAPVDRNKYLSGANIIIAGPGTLVKTGMDFSGWNTNANGTETGYSEGGTLVITGSNIVLYAQWKIKTPHTVTYDGNGNSDGLPPTDTATYLEGTKVTVAEVGSLKKTGLSFTGWNTSSDGTGTAFSPGSILTMGSSNITLYAQWKSATAGLSFTLINGNTEYSVTKGTADTNGIVVIPEYYDSKKVTAIGTRAFYECKGMTSIIIPDSIQLIGEYAFQYCDGLKSFRIPEGITAINNSTFANCRGVMSISIPDSVTSIGPHAFWDCDSLASISIPKNVTTIGYEAFAYNNALASIILPEGVLTLEFGIFKYCDNLSSVTLPDSIVTLGADIFSGCKYLQTANIPVHLTSLAPGIFNGCANLQSIIIPNGMTSIGSGSFADCRSLKVITIPDSVTFIDDFAFFSCTGLTNMIIPDNVKTIMDCAFQNCSNLSDITLSKNITEIAEGLFQGCGKLSSLVIPENVTSIGKVAFKNCTLITTVQIPSKVTLFGSTPFSGCSKLMIVIIDAIEPPNMVSSSMAFENCTALSAIKVPAASINAYKSANGWKSYAEKIVAQ